MCATLFEECNAQSVKVSAGLLVSADTHQSLGNKVTLLAELN